MFATTYLSGSFHRRKVTGKSHSWSPGFHSDASVASVASGSCSKKSAYFRNLNVVSIQRLSLHINWWNTKWWRKCATFVMHSTGLIPGCRLHVSFIPFLWGRAWRTHAFSYFFFRPSTVIFSNYFERCLAWRNLAWFFSGEIQTSRARTYLEYVEFEVHSTGLLPVLAASCLVQTMPPWQGMKNLFSSLFQQSYSISSIFSEQCIALQILWSLILPVRFKHLV